MNFPFFYPRRGSALLLVICAVAVMSLAVMGLVEFSANGLAESSFQEKKFRALQLAESGLALGLHPQIGKADPILEREQGPFEKYSVKVRTEGSRLNINAILLGKNQKPLRDLLTTWGVSSRDLPRIVDSLMDWVDPDPLKRLNGAEERDYESAGMIGFPPNRPFASVDEMALVPGMEQVAKVKPDWKDSFTVWSDGKLDLNEASADLIESVCDVGSANAESFVRRRLGPDGKINTSDDFNYTDLDQARMALGLSAAAFNSIEPYITLKSSYRRIVSTGQAGSCEHSIAVVVQINTNPIQYLTWSEY